MSNLSCWCEIEPSFTPPCSKFNFPPSNVFPPPVRNCYHLSYKWGLCYTSKTLSSPFKKCTLSRRRRSELSLYFNKLRKQFLISAALISVPITGNMVARKLAISAHGEWYLDREGKAKERGGGKNHNHSRHLVQFSFISHRANGGRTRESVSVCVCVLGIAQECPQSSVPNGRRCNEPIWRTRCFDLGT